MPCLHACKFTLLPICTAVADFANALIGVYRSTPSSRTSCKRLSKNRPSVILCGLFLLWLPRANRLLSVLCEKCSRLVSPPASNGRTSSFFLVYFTESPCRGKVFQTSRHTAACKCYHACNNVVVLHDKEQAVTHSSFELVQV